MATSSIFREIFISKRSKVKKFIKAIEKSGKDKNESKCKVSCKDIKVEEIERFFN